MPVPFERRRQPTLEALEPRDMPAVFVVNSVLDLADTTPGNGTVETSVAGARTLRAAIQEANALAGPDTINFAIPGTGNHTITLSDSLGELPSIGSGLTIDGYTQPGSRPNTAGPGAPDNAVLRINLDGSAVVSGADGLVIDSAEIVTVRGLAITGFVSKGGDGSVGNGHGIVIVNGSVGHVVEGNFIGTNLAGTVARGNRANGVLISNSQNNRIGGTAPAARNVISGNTANGVAILTIRGGDFESTDNSVVGNFIGTDASGRRSLGNGSNGVFINARNNQVGGTLATEANVIAFNGTAGRAAGIRVDDDGRAAGFATSNALARNSIFNNNGLGIDLVGGTEVSDVTANDDGDGDAGPNALQNFPVLAAATSLPGRTIITGSLNGLVDRTFRIEFFASPTADPSGFGEGHDFLGTQDVTVPAGGTVLFRAVVAPLPAGQLRITATATDISVDVGGADTTSEFSAAITARRIVVGSSFGGTVYYPFRLVPRGNVYEGFVAVLSPVDKGGPTTLVLHGLPRGVRLLNATGTTAAGDPFFTVASGLRRNVPLRFLCVFSNAFAIYDITFLHGFRINVVSGPFDPGTGGGGSGELP